jgi:hypothetical protein
MALMWKDTTGTSTDCEKPLSRKKLKALMPHSRMGLTSRELFAKTGRTNWKIRRELAEAEAQRKAEAELDAANSKTTAKLIPLAPKEESKPNLFKRLGSLFGDLRKRAERESARKGK